MGAGMVPRDFTHATLRVARERYRIRTVCFPATFTLELGHSTRAPTERGEFEGTLSQGGARRLAWPWAELRWRFQRIKSYPPIELNKMSKLPLNVAIFRRLSHRKWSLGICVLTASHSLALDLGRGSFP